MKQRTKEDVIEHIETMCNVLPAYKKRLEAIRKAISLYPSYIAMVVDEQLNEIKPIEQLEELLELDNTDWLVCVNELGLMLISPKLPLQKVLAEQALEYCMN